VRGVQIERHLEALLSLNAVAQALVERSADAVVHLHALLAVGGQVGDAGHVVDGLGGVALLLEELRQRFERRDVRIVDVDDVAVGVDGVVEVLDFIGVHLRHRRVELDLDRALERGVDVPVIRVDEVEPLAHTPVAALEAVERALVPAVDLDDLVKRLSAGECLATVAPQVGRTETSSPETGHPYPYRSGYPGRPSVTRLVEAELRRRAAARKCCGSLAEEARDLHEWVNQAHPNAPHLPTPRTIENQIRDLYRTLVRKPATK